jgi:hypothetical protein
VPRFFLSLHCIFFAFLETFICCCCLSSKNTEYTTVRQLSIFISFSLTLPLFLRYCFSSFFLLFSVWKTFIYIIKWYGYEISRLVQSTWTWLSYSFIVVMFVVCNCTHKITTLHIAHSFINEWEILWFIQFYENLFHSLFVIKNRQRLYGYLVSPKMFNNSAL